MLLLICVIPGGWQLLKKNALASLHQVDYRSLKSCRCTTRKLWDAAGLGAWLQPIDRSAFSLQAAVLLRYSSWCPGTVVMDRSQSIKEKLFEIDKKRGRKNWTLCIK